MRKEFLIVEMFVKFGYNFPEPSMFIDYICEKCDKKYLKSHLLGKWKYNYEIFGSHGVMNYFFCELDEDLKEALVDYAVNVYSPKGMKRCYEEYKSL